MSHRHRQQHRNRGHYGSSGGYQGQGRYRPSFTGHELPIPTDPYFLQYKFNGNIYLDPDNKTDLYFNIGLASYGRQTYPAYEDWLKPYVSETTYNQWIDALKKELKNAAAARPRCCEGFLGHITCGVYACAKYCKQKSLEASLLKLSDTMAQESTPLDVRLVLICNEPNPSLKMWKDSRGQPDDTMQHKYGGSPYGINLVLRLPTEIQWPPKRVGTQPNAGHPEPNEENCGGDESAPLHPSPDAKK